MPANILKALLNLRDDRAVQAINIDQCISQYIIPLDISNYASGYVLLHYIL